MKKLFIVLIVILFATISFAGEKEIVEKTEEIKASAIIPLKLEGLKWKLKYHQEKTVSMQLRAMISVWNQVEFQETQKIIRQTDQEIKHLLVK